MSLTVEEKAQIIGQYQRSGADTGSPQVQVAILTHEINRLTEHFKVHKKDHHSRRGLYKKINLRRKLLDYLKDNDLQGYQTLIGQLGIRY